ncbi:MAG TPA: hypothetical protein VGZ73_03045 [Bryobacteraceae bacterium]|nr:hypothetical protein [Bryobacteraceae bacterium]
MRASIEGDIHLYLGAFGGHAEFRSMAGIHEAGAAKDLEAARWKQEARNVTIILHDWRISGSPVMMLAHSA